METTRRGAAGDDLEVVSAQPADAGEIAPLLRAFYAEAGYGFDSASVGALEALLAQPALGRAWLAREGRGAVGYAVACFGWSLEHRGRDAFVDELYVSPSQRGRGIAQRLLAALEAECAALGVSVLHLEVERDNDVASALYAARGFADSGRRLLSKPLRGSR